MPENNAQQHSMKKLLFWAGGLIAVLAIIGALSGTLLMSQRTLPTDSAAKVSGDAIRMGEAPLPSFTAQVQEKLRTSEGFDALVSYTDSGFEPGFVSVMPGKTVRFTNNSSKQLLLTIDGERTMIAPQDFFEKRFGTTGTFGYSDGTDSGTVSVK